MLKSPLSHRLASLVSFPYVFPNLQLKITFTVKRFHTTNISIPEYCTWNVPGVVRYLPHMFVINLRRLNQKRRIGSAYWHRRPFGAQSLPIGRREITQSAVRHRLVRFAEGSVSERHMAAETCRKHWKCNCPRASDGSYCIFVAEETNCSVDRTFFGTRM